MSSGSVTTSKKATVRKAIDVPTAEEKAKKARERGNLAYWRITQPGYVSLSGAAALVAKSHMAGAANPATRWVYYPDLRVAGTVQDIGNLLAGGGQYLVGGKASVAQGGNGYTGQRAQLTGYDQIYNASFDPLNPADLQIITSLKKAPSVGKKSEVVDAGVWLAIGEVLAKNAPSKSKGGKGKKGATSETTVASHLQQRINDFEAMMAQILAGATPDKILNVTKFNTSNFTEARKAAAPVAGGRSNAIHPSIVVQGREVKVPLFVQPEAVANLRAFVDLVVRRSRYAQVADEIIANINRRLAERQTLSSAPVSMLAPSTIQMQPMQSFGGPVSMLQQPTALPMQSFGGPVSMLPMNTSVGGFPQGFAAPAGSLSPGRSGLASPAPMSALQLPNVQNTGLSGGMLPLGTRMSPTQTLIRQ